MATLSPSEQQYLQSIINDPLKPPLSRQSAERLLQLNNRDVFEGWVKSSMPRDSARILSSLAATPPTASRPSGFSLPPRGGASFYGSKGYHGVWSATTPTHSVPRTVSGPGFRLHKGGGAPRPNYGVETHAVREAIAGKWDDLNDVVREATQQTVTGWGDIADIDPDTGAPVGGVASYIDTSAPETYDSMGVPNEIPTRTIGVDPLGVAKPYNPWARSSRPKVRVIRKGAKSATAASVGISNRASELAFQAFLQGQHESLRTQNAQATRLADAAQTISFSNRFRLAHHLSRFDSVEGRRQYLEAAGFDPDAAYGRSLMNMAEAEYANRKGHATYAGPPNITDRDTYTKGQNWSIPTAYQAGIPIGGGRLGSGGGGGGGGIRHGSSVGYNWDFPGMSISPTSLMDLPSQQHTTESIWDKLYKNLDKFGNALSGVGSLLTTAGGAWNTVYSEYDKQGKRITTAASGLIPAPFRNAFTRTASGIRELWSSEQALYSGRLSAAGSMAGGLAGIIGGAMTGNPMGVIGGIGGLVNGGAQWWQAGVKSKGLDITGRINLWNGALEAILAPFRMIGPVIHRVIASLKALSLRVLDTAAKFTQLGLPLTSLTGVSYANMRNNYGSDYMIGANRGTSNGAIETFAGAQMDLFTFGKMDENRLIASALLGAFGDVYAYGGNTQDQYANTVNKVYSQLGHGAQSDQRVMNLARYIDPTIATRVQQMRNLSSFIDPRFSDYNFIQSGQWMASRGISFHQTSDKQRARYTIAGMEANSLLENMSESWNMLLVHAWEKLGKNVAITINDILGSFAETGNWRDIVPKVKKALLKLWDDALELFGIEGDFGGWFGNVLKSITPYIQNWAIDIGTWILNKEADLLEQMAIPLDRFITSLSFLRVGVDFKDGKLSFTTSNPLTDWQNVDLGNKRTAESVARSIQGDANSIGYIIPDSVWNKKKVQSAYGRSDRSKMPLFAILRALESEGEIEEFLALNPSLGTMEEAMKWYTLSRITDPKARNRATKLLFNQEWMAGDGVFYDTAVSTSRLLRAEAQAIQQAKVATAEIKVTAGGKEGTVTAYSDGSTAFRGDVFNYSNLTGAVAGVLDNLTGGIAQ